MARPVSARVIALAAAASMSLSMDFEGLRYYAYPDPIGIPTICYGHTAGVKMGQVANEATCKRLLGEDTHAAMSAVLKHTTAELNSNELGAYTDFTLNVGETKFRNSTLLKKLNAGDHSGACRELLRWVYAGGKKFQGLVNRRTKGYALCIKPEIPNDPTQQNSGRVADYGLRPRSYRMVPAPQRVGS